MNTRIYNKMNEKISSILDNQLFDNLDKNIKQIIVSILHKLDLVTREEFEVQQKLLQKLIVKVEQIEKKIALLENDNQIK